MFECQIGASQPSYHWLKDGRNISKGSISLVGSLSTLSVGNLEFSDSGNYSCIATDRQSGQSGEKTGILTVKGTFSFLRGTIYLVCRTLLGDKIARLSFWARRKRSCSCFSKFYYMAGSSLLESWVLSFFGSFSSTYPFITLWGTSVLFSLTPKSWNTGFSWYTNIDAVSLLCRQI